MPWNGSGVFNRVYNWTADANANIDILPDRMDTDTNDIATGLEHCLTVNGETLPVANINFNNYKITNAAQGTAGTDYVTVGQVNGGGGGVSAGGFVPIAGGTVVGALTVNGAIYAAGAIRHPSIGATGNHNFAVGWDGSFAHIWVDGTDTGQQATVAWVQGQNYATQSFVTGQGYATQSWVQGQGYITNAALSGYATQSWVNSQGYATQGFVTGQGYATTGYVNSTVGNYVPLSGAAMSGSISMPNNAAYGGRDTSNNFTALIYMGSDNTIHIGGGRNISMDASGSAAVYTGGNIVVGGIVYLGPGQIAWYQDGGGFMHSDSTLRTFGIEPTADNGSSCGLSGIAWAQISYYINNPQSSRALKHDIAPVPEGALSQVLALQPSRYRWKQLPVLAEGVTVPDSLHTGFIADEIRAALGPEFGGYYQDSEGRESYDPNEMLALLWAAVRELAAQVRTGIGA